MELTLVIPSVSTKAYKILSQRGIDDVDDFELVNPVSKVAANGTLIQGSVGFRRRMSVDFGLVKEKADRVYLVSWILANNRQITFAGETISVSLPDLRELVARLLNSCKYFKAFQMTMVDRLPLTSAPSAWAEAGIYTSDGKPVITSDGKVVYAHT